MRALTASCGWIGVVALCVGSAWAAPLRVHTVERKPVVQKELRAASIPVVKRLTAPRNDHSGASLLRSQIHDAETRVARLKLLSGHAFAKTETAPSPVRSEILMRVPVRDSEILDKIDRFGILTQYITASSNGMSNIAARYDTERDSLANRTDHLPLDLLPKYGYLNVIGRPGNLDETPLRQYGNAIFVFKDEVRNRTTFHVGDSLFNETPMTPLSDTDALARAAATSQPRYFEAQVWGPINFDHVHQIMLDGNVRPAVLATLKKLSEKYGFSIVKANDAQMFNQSLPLSRSPLYQPKRASSGSAFHPLDEAEILASLKGAPASDLPVLLANLTALGGAKHRALLKSYLTHKSENVNRTAQLCLADIGDPDVLAAVGTDKEVRDVRRFVEAHLATAQGKSIALRPDQLSPGEARQHLLQLSSENAIDAKEFARFAEAQSIRTRIAVVEVLSKRPGQASAVLETLAADGSPEVARVVIDHLAEVPPALSARLIKIALGHSDAGVRAALASALDPKRHASTLLQLGKDAYPEVLIATFLRDVGKKAWTETQARELAAAPSLEKRIEGTIALISLNQAGTDEQVTKLLATSQPWHEKATLTDAALAAVRLRSGKIAESLLSQIASEASLAAPLFGHLIENNAVGNEGWLRSRLKALATGVAGMEAYGAVTPALAHGLARFFASETDLGLLETMAGATSRATRDLALQTLGLMGSPARPTLVRLAKTGDSATRAGAAGVLAGLP